MINRYSITAFILFLILMLYLGHDIPVEEFERAVLVRSAVQYRPGSDMVSTICVYSDSTRMRCEYIVDPRHTREAAEALQIKLYMEQNGIYDERLDYNMRARWHHIKRELGCKWIEGPSSKTTWGGLKKGER